MIEKRIGDIRFLDDKPIPSQVYLPITEVEEDAEASYKLPNKELNIESLETDVHEKLIEFPSNQSNSSSNPKSMPYETLSNLPKPLKPANPPLFQFTQDLKPVKMSLIQVLRPTILRDKSSFPSLQSQSSNPKLKFVSEVSKIFEEQGFGPAIRMKTKAKAKTESFPTVTVYAPVQSKPNEVFLDQFSTPSFSEKDIYAQKEVLGRFETFGKINKPEVILAERKEEEGQFDTFTVENDNEQVRMEKMKKLEDRRVKRIEELEKRITKKALSPDRITLIDKVHASSPVPSPKPSPRPSTKIEVRNSPKPSHKNREEVKSVGDKYKRHKNLPNLVYNKPSNKKIVKNAISQVCLAGEPNRAHREEVLALIERLADVNYFIIVFSDSIRRDVRGLYSHDPNTGEVNKVYGPAYLPDLLDATCVTSFFRYDSGAREFKLLQCRDFIVATDAVCLKKTHKVYENN